MTDNGVQTPIMVDASPRQAQLATAIRQILLGAGVLTTALGATHIGAQLSAAAAAATYIAMALGGVVTVGTVVWGQLHTRSTAKKLAITADAAPPSVAQLKS